MNTKHIGDHGEALAAQYLKDAGYQIMDRNYRYERAEIDLVCFDPSGATRGEIVFIEVKTRSGLAYGSPEEAVTNEKQERIAHASEAYLYERRLEGAPARFDVVSILLNQDEAPDINHFKDAFWAS
jgi:putative endonuclease